jgi:uncharacterized protein with HEPN domain
MAATRSPRVRLLHIRDEIDAITGVVHGVTYEQYQSSYILRRTVERAVQIISEAAKALPHDLCSRYSEAPWNAIVGVGNVLRHEYQRVDDRRLWDIATSHLPQLLPVIERMIADLKE